MKIQIFGLLFQILCTTRRNEDSEIAEQMNSSTATHGDSTDYETASNGDSSEQSTIVMDISESVNISENKCGNENGSGSGNESENENFTEVILMDDDDSDHFDLQEYLINEKKKSDQEALINQQLDIFNFYTLLPTQAEEYNKTVTTFKKANLSISSINRFFFDELWKFDNEFRKYYKKTKVYIVKGYVLERNYFICLFLCTNINNAWNNMKAIVEVSQSEELRQKMESRKKEYGFIMYYQQTFAERKNDLSVNRVRASHPAFKRHE